MFDSFSFFSLSFSTLRSHLVSFFLFSPPQVSQIKSSLPNLVILAILFGFLNWIAFVTSQLINLNPFTVISNFMRAFFTKPLNVIFQIAFSILIAKFYSIITSDGKMRLSYCYMSLLSSIHLPFVLFITFAFYSDDMLKSTVLMGIQGFITDYISRNTIDSKDIKGSKLRFMIISMVLHVLFYSIVMRYVYSI